MSVQGAKYHKQALSVDVPYVYIHVCKMQGNKQASMHIYIYICLHAAVFGALCGFEHFAKQHLATDLINHSCKP